MITPAGSYHLLHLMFDEYVLYTVEHLYNQDKGNQLFRAAKGEISLGTCCIYIVCFIPIVCFGNAYRLL